MFSPSPGTPMLITRGAAGLTGEFVGPYQIPNGETLWVLATPNGLVMEHPMNMVIDE